MVVVVIAAINPRWQKMFRINPYTGPTNALMIERNVNMLQSPPRPGQSYWVPTFQTQLNGLRSMAWPVLFPIQVDDWNKELLHFHFDARFLTEEQIEAMRLSLSPNDRPDIYSPDMPEREMAIRGQVFDLEQHEGPREPQWRYLECQRLPMPFTGGCIKYLKDKQGGKPVQCVMRNGTPFCPHQRTALLGFWDGQSQTVRCPMHGLEVDMGKAIRTQRGTHQPKSSENSATSEAGRGGEGAEK